mmetsp:Transcript_109656/g.310223  ORF Transcript_109656/g.310223 Transcript_109656/m.310223 type:complete len:312 (-) Transcript_109656:132-1067(-)
MPLGAPRLVRGPGVWGGQVVEGNPGLAPRHEARSQDKGHVLPHRPVHLRERRAEAVPVEDVAGEDLPLDQEPGEDQAEGEDVQVEVAVALTRVRGQDADVDVADVVLQRRGQRLLRAQEIEHAALEPLVRVLAGVAEVDDLDQARLLVQGLGADHDVVHLEVPVRDLVVVVQVRQRAQHLPRDVVGLVPPQRAHRLGERPSWYVVHDHGAAAAGGEEVGHAHDVGVGEPPEDLVLVAQPLERVHALARVGNLDGELPGPLEAPHDPRGPAAPAPGDDGARGVAGGGQLLQAVDLLGLFRQVQTRVGVLASR